MEAWRHAGPELARIRNEELRALDDDAGQRLIGAGNRRDVRESGLAIWQQWMMRWRAPQQAEMAQTSNND